ncbi:MAG: efflux RND transporter periplasmic adaptor subunit [Rhizomicrobium sp.]
MEVDTNVSESDVGGVRVGDKALFTVEAFPDDTFEGVVSQVRQAPQTVQNVVTYDVVATVANPRLLLKPGMTATVRVVTAERANVLRVPDSALRYVPGGLSASSAQAGAPPSELWILREGRPTRLAVTAGLDDGNFTEILTGDLKAGDSVIVSERSGTGRKPANGGPAMRLP